MIYESLFLFAVFWTVVLEVPVVLILWKLVFRKNDPSWLRVVIVAALASALTLPYFWFILPPYVDASLYIWWGEGLVFVAEALIYWVFLCEKLSWPEGLLRSLVLSGVANAVSYVFGIYLLPDIVEFLF